MLREDKLLVVLLSIIGIMGLLAAAGLIWAMILGA